jgi:hypothetical protein
VYSNKKTKGTKKQRNLFSRMGWMGGMMREAFACVPGHARASSLSLHGEGGIRIRIQNVRSVTRG